MDWEWKLLKLSSVPVPELGWELGARNPNCSPFSSVGLELFVILILALGEWPSQVFPKKQLRTGHMDRGVCGRLFQAELPLLEESAAEALVCQRGQRRAGNHLGRELPHILIKG